MDLLFLVLLLNCKHNNILKKITNFFLNLIIESCTMDLKGKPTNLPCSLKSLIFQLISSALCTSHCLQYDEISVSSTSRSNHQWVYPIPQGMTVKLHIKPPPLHHQVILQTNNLIIYDDYKFLTSLSRCYSIILWFKF